jgi:sugar phosphate isomerase/epimerase
MPTTWLDPLFFPAPEVCQKIFAQVWEELGAVPIHHRQVFEEGLIEVSPLMEVPLEEVLNGGVGVVVDLRHLRRMGDLSRSSFVAAQDLLGTLLPRTQLIHVQAWDAAEWRDFLAGRYSQLQVLLGEAVAGGYTGPFVIEFDPRAFGPTGLLPRNLAKNLRRVRERVEDIL